MNRLRSLAQFCLAHQFLHSSASPRSSDPEADGRAQDPRRRRGHLGRDDQVVPERARLRADGLEGRRGQHSVTGGLWVASTFQGDFGGMTFEGRGQFGYDPAKKKYVGTWIDSMSPASASWREPTTPRPRR